MADELRKRYETEYAQMADFELWRRIVGQVEGMKQSMFTSIGNTNDFEKFLAWRGELNGIERVERFLKDPLKNLQSSQITDERPETK